VGPVGLYSLVNCEPCVNYWWNTRRIRISEDTASYFMGCLHDPANVQQISSKCIQNIRANAGRLLDVCWIMYTPY